MIRRTPIKKRRTEPRRGEPTHDEKRILREERYRLAGGRCEIQKHSKCSGRYTLPLTGDIFNRAHLVHLHARRVYGWDIENLRIGCYWCHAVFMHANGGCEKIVSAKERAA